MHMRQLIADAGFWGSMMIHRDVGQHALNQVERA
jgi:hypothetical protein